MIYYFAFRIGGVYGADQAASDILSCLRALNVPLTVLCQETVPFSREPSSTNLGGPDWLKSPRFVRFPSKIGRRLAKELIKWFISTVQDLPLRYRLYKRIKRDGPELVIFNDIVPHPDLVARFKRTGKIVGVIHDSPVSLQFYFNSFERECIERWAKAAAAAYDAMIFVSPKGRDEWRAFSVLAHKEMYVIPNSCREEEVRGLLQQDKGMTRETLGIDPDLFVLVCVASVQPRKGQDLLIKALSELLGVIPQPKLYLVGPPGLESWMNALRDQVEASGLADYVDFLGSRRDALAFIHAADVFILPSRAEAQGIAILEAMALKTPVVAADIGGIPEIIQNGINGLLFPVDDVQKLAECIKRLYDDAPLSKMFAERASNTYWQSFSQQRQLELYRETVAKMLV